MKKLIFILIMCLGSVVYGQQTPEAGLKTVVYGQGKPVLLIPGLACSGQVWESTVDSLKDRYECHVLTLPGFAGQPAMEHEGRYLQKVKEEIMRYLDSRQLNNVGLIGHSLGGFLSLQLAAESPERFSSVVIVDAAPFMPALQMPGITEEGARPIAENMRRMMQNQKPETREANQRGYLSTMVSGQQDLEQILTWNLATDQETMAQAMYELYCSDYRKEIAGITAPVLVMGAWIAYKDYGVTKESCLQAYKSQYKNLPQAKVVISDAGKHFLMYDDPAFYFSQLQEMLP